MSYDVIASQPIVIDNVSEEIASCLFNFWHHLSKRHFLGKRIHLCTYLAGEGGLQQSTSIVAMEFEVGEGVELG